MDAVEDIVKGLLIVGVWYTILWLFVGVLVQIPGYFVYSLFVASEYDPDRRTELDPSGRMSTVIGLTVWTVILGGAYLVYRLAK